MQGADQVALLVTGWVQFEIRVEVKALGLTRSLGTANSLCESD